MDLLWPWGIWQKWCKTSRLIHWHRHTHSQPTHTPIHSPLSSMFLAEDVFDLVLGHTRWCVALTSGGRGWISCEPEGFDKNDARRDKQIDIRMQTHPITTHSQPTHTPTHTPIHSPLSTMLLAEAVFDLVLGWVWHARWCVALTPGRRDWISCEPEGFNKNDARRDKQIYTLTQTHPLTHPFTHHFNPHSNPS